jgi:hypothetical protein
MPSSEGQSARPRRLSSAFLASERRELEAYRTDARPVLPGHQLPPVVDGRSGTILQPEWSHRYPFDLTPPPNRGADGIVRRGSAVCHKRGFKNRRLYANLTVMRVGPLPPLALNNMNVDCAFRFLSKAASKDVQVNRSPIMREKGSLGLILFGVHIFATRSLAFRTPVPKCHPRN